MTDENCITHQTYASLGIIKAVNNFRRLFDHQMTPDDAGENDATLVKRFQDDKGGAAQMNDNEIGITPFVSLFQLELALLHNRLRTVILTI